jgi:hypothetical protein
MVTGKDGDWEREKPGRVLRQLLPGPVPPARVGEVLGVCRCGCEWSSTRTKRKHVAPGVPDRGLISLVLAGIGICFCRAVINSE